STGSRRVTPSEPVEASYARSPPVRVERGSTRGAGTKHAVLAAGARRMEAQRVLPDATFAGEFTNTVDGFLRAAVLIATLEVAGTIGGYDKADAHDLADIERLCSRLLIIDHGRVIHDGTLDGLRDRFGSARMLVVDFADAIDAVDLPPAEVVRMDGPRQ